MPLTHRPPRHPHAWLPLFAASQVAVAAVWLAAGWGLGLPLMAATHGALVWATLWPRSRLLSPVATRLDGAARAVWLTIDDGPSEDTRAILDVLDAHGAKATFFVVGQRARARPALVREIVRRGHGIGHHSDAHPSGTYWLRGPGWMRRDVAAAQATLTELAGHAPRWFRGVVGMCNPFVAAAIAPHGLARVAWSARGFDAVNASPQDVVARIERGLTPGAIVLLHEGAAHGRNVETLRLLLQRLETLGYACVVPEDAAADVVQPASNAAVAG